jgi:acetyltransferase-like isoleucine patch superfamily enzyme
MLKYIIGWLKNFFNPAISFFALIDDASIVSKKAKINRAVKIYDSVIDSYSYVGGGSDIVCTEISKFCSIAHNCTIGIGNHSLKNISTSPIFTEQNNGTGSSWTTKNTTEKFNRVSIGNDVWIGTKVIIMGGLSIGDGAIIGAGSIVTKDIPAYAVAAGVPAKVIRYRFEEPVVERLLAMKWWNLSEEKLKKNIDLFQTENFNLSDLKRFED